MECDFCHFETNTINYPSRDLRQKGKSLDLCTLCAATPAGNLAFKPWEDPTGVNLLSAMNYSTNLILKAIEHLSEEEE